MFFSPKRSKKPKVEIKELSSGKRISFKKFKELNSQDRKEFFENAISEKGTLSKRILNKKQLEEAIENGSLHIISFQGERYFLREELSKYANQLLQLSIKKSEE